MDLCLSRMEWESVIRVLGEGVIEWLVYSSRNCTFSIVVLKKITKEINNMTNRENNID